MARVLLIGPPWGDVYGNFKHVAKVGVFYPPLGLCYLKSPLVADGHTVRVVDGEASGLSLPQILALVEDFKADMVGIQVVSPLWETAKTMAAAIKERFGIPIMAGGPHMTLTAMESMREAPAIDYVVTSEAEDSTRDLVRALFQGNSNDIDKVPGLLYRTASGEIRTTPPRTLRADVDHLLFPDRSDLDHSKYLFSVPGAGIRRFTTLITSRGCPYNCTFCTEPLMYGRTTRFRSATNVVDEIQEFHDKHQINHFIFVDDTLTTRKERIMDMCAQLKERKLDITWEGWTHVNTVSPDLLKVMHSAGLRRLSFGIESGNAEVLKSLQKNSTLPRVRDAYRWAKEAGIETRGSVILGLPGDTRESVQETIDFVVNLKECDHAYFNIAMPYPGTEIRRQALAGEAGVRLLTEEYSELRRQGQKVVMEVNDLDTKALLQLQRQAYLRFWLTPRRIWYNVVRSGFKAALQNGWAFFRSFIMPTRNGRIKFISEITDIYEAVNGAAQRGRPAA
jgi:anaerobic magnesium-protoporphyrin IX monomethyl ester cyclase